MAFPSKTNYLSGDVLTAAQMNDIGSEINALNGTAGKNKIINGDFGIWQRGTSFAAASGAFYADRWTCDFADANPTSATVSQQTFTAGTAPVSGYEGTFFLRQTITTVGSCTILNLGQKIENVRTFAGETATVSFWAKSDLTRTQTLLVYQNFGSGGSSLVTVATPTFSTTTSWQRFTFTVTVPSISGKTIGTNNCFQVIIRQALAAGSVLDIWGFQVESGNLATAFQTATGTLAGELAACQRYFCNINYQATTRNAYNALGNGYFSSTTNARIFVKTPVTLRTIPSSLSYTGTITADDGVAAFNATNITLNQLGTDYVYIDFTVSGATQFRPCFAYTNNDANARLSFNAEL